MQHQRPVLNQVNLVVSDMEASTAFYQRLGLEMRESQPPWDRHHITVASDGELHFDLDSQQFARHWDEGWPAIQDSGVLISFRVATRGDVDRVYADLTGAGYHGQQAPYDAFWGARFAVVEDPDGNPVGIMSPADAAHRSAEPDPDAPPGARQ